MMKDFSPERLEQLHTYMNSNIRDFEDVIYEIGLFDCDGIYGKTMQASMRLYAEELSERNQYAYIKVKEAFENVWETERKGSSILSEIKEQLKGYSEYVQGMGNMMRSGDCSSTLFARKHISSLYKKMLHMWEVRIDLQKDQMFDGLDSMALIGADSIYGRPSLNKEEIELLRESLAEVGVPEDFVADKVVILNQPGGAMGLGHNALIIIGEDGSGLFYSFGGNFDEEAISIACGNDSISHLDAIYLTKENVKVFFTGNGLISEVTEDNAYNNLEINPDSDEISETGKDENGGDKEKAYINGTLIDISEEQGWLMISEAERIRNSSDEPYNLYSDNCEQRVSQIVWAAGIRYGKPSGDSINRRLYNGIIEYQKSNLPYILDFDIFNSFVDVYNTHLFVKNVFVNEYIGAQQDGTIPNDTYEIEAEAGQEKGWISGTLSELYGEFSDE